MLPPTILVIFGITGDLSQRYVLPALSAIKAAGQLPSSFKLIGLSRRDVKVDEVLGNETKNLKENLEVFKIDMDSLDYFRSLKKRIAEVSKKPSRRPQVIFYLLLPPDIVPNTISLLGKALLNKPNMKLLLEKPFGSDEKSAKTLINEISQHFKENQICRIDHYLAKEVAQSIVVFLGSNAIFRGVWDRRLIEKIQIVASEKIGVEGRGNSYEQTGALRDFAQSHLMQLAALTLMEPSPDPFDLGQVASRRLAALKSIRPVEKHELKSMVAGQYGGYKEDSDYPTSITETFIAFTIYSNDQRWKKVPIQLVTGKRLEEKLTEIRVYFKRSHVSQTNLLILRIQPREGIELDLWVKEPGYDRKLRRVSHRFDYDQHFGRLPDAYEQVLVDAMRGSLGLFASSEEVLASWKILQPILSHWSKKGKNLVRYKPGSTIENILGSSL